MKSLCVLERFTRKVEKHRINIELERERDRDKKMCVCERERERERERESLKSVRVFYPVAFVVSDLFLKLVGLN